MEGTYAELEHRIVVYGHIHLPFVRRVCNLTVASSRSVGLPFDGDPRASYLLITESIAVVRRVEYDVEREVRALLASGLPHRNGWPASSARADCKCPERDIGFAETISLRNRRRPLGRDQSSAG